MVLDFLKDTSLTLNCNFAHSRIKRFILVPPQLNTCMFCLFFSSRQSIKKPRLAPSWKVAVNSSDLSTLLPECWGYMYESASPVYVLHVINPRALWRKHSDNWTVCKGSLHAIAWGWRFKFHKEISKSVTLQYCKASPAHVGVRRN